MNPDEQPGVRAKPAYAFDVANTPLKKTKQCYAFQLLNTLSIFNQAENSLFQQRHYPKYR